MANKEMVQSFIDTYNSDFSADEGFPTLGKIEAAGEKTIIHVSDQGFEDQEVRWLKDYFKMGGIGIDYDPMIPAIIIL